MSNNREWHGLTNAKGDILAILNDDINQLERFLDKGANDLLQVSTTVVVVGAVFCDFVGGGPLCRLTHPPNVLGRSDTSEVSSRGTLEFETPLVK